MHLKPLIRGVRYNLGSILVLREIIKLCWFTRVVWSEEVDIPKVLSNTWKDIIECQLTQSLCSEDPGMTKVLFNTLEDVIKY